MRSSPEPSDRFPGWSVVIASFVTLMTTSGLAFYGLAVYLNSLSKERGWSVSSISAAVAVFFLVGGLSGLVVARQMAKRDVRLIVVLGAVLGAGALAMLGQVQEIWQVYLVYAVFSIGHTACGLVPATTVVTRWFHTKRSTALSIASTGLSMGGIALTPFVKWALDSYGLSATTPWLAVVWLVGIVPVTLLLMHPDPGRMGWLPDGARAAPHSTPRPPAGAPFTFAVRTRFFYAVTIAYTFVLGAQVGAIQQLVKLVEERTGRRHCHRRHIGARRHQRHRPPRRRAGRGADVDAPAHALDGGAAGSRPHVHRRVRVDAAAVRGDRSVRCDDRQHPDAPPAPHRRGVRREGLPPDLQPLAVLLVRRRCVRPVPARVAARQRRRLPHVVPLRRRVLARRRGGVGSRRIDGGCVRWIGLVVRIARYGSRLVTARHPNVDRVIAAAAERGLVIEPRQFPDGTKTAADAAAAIGVDVGQIVKSLIFAVDGEVVLAYVSGANQLDEKKLAAAAGGLKSARVDADTVRAATGFPIGGVPPFGHATHLRVFVDPDLLQYDEVWAAAGTWHDVFGIEPHRLVEASDGVVTDLKRA